MNYVRCRRTYHRYYFSFKIILLYGGFLLWLNYNYYLAGKGDPYFTFRMKQDDGQLVCGTVQMDVRDTLRNGLGKSGNELVATFGRTSFSGNEQAKSNLVKNSQVRIDLQGMFTQYGKRWANLQIQRNGNGHPKPTTMGHVFLEADKTFPIRLVRNAFVESMSRCVKVWLAIYDGPNTRVPLDP